MESNEATIIFTIASTFVSLVFNILSYRLIFKKKTRNKANLFSWLSTLGFMIPVILILMALLTKGVTGGLGLLGWALAMVLVLAPLFWFVPPSLYTLIRAIFIAFTKNKEVNNISKLDETPDMALLEDT